MTIRVIRGHERATTTTAATTSEHSFSFGDHYDPSNTHHGVLLAHNDEIVTPGHGFDTHLHRETEIITWVTSGSLVHQDSEGHSGLIYPGLAQRMTAGRGIEHSERNDTWDLLTAGAAPTHAARTSGLVPVRFIAMWVLPDEPGLSPDYDQHDVTTDLEAGGLVTIAAGDPSHDAAIRIANRGAALYAARLSPGEQVVTPSARFGHLFVVSGSVYLGEVTLHEGDAARTVDAGGEPIVGAGAPGTRSEILLWSMSRALGQW